MKPDSLKRIINAFSSSSTVEPDMEMVRLKRFSGGVRILSYSHGSVSNSIIDEMLPHDCMVHVSKKDYLSVLFKQYKKEDVPMSEFLKHVVEYKEPLYKVDDLMTNTAQAHKLSSFTIDFKELEKLYKSMKQKSNNIRIDVTEGSHPVIVCNEEGDVSILSKII